MIPDSVRAYLTDAARAARTSLPDDDGSLFRAGVLDSFSLVEFVALLEDTCGIRVEDAELRPETFETIGKIGAFLERAGSAV